MMNRDICPITVAQAAEAWGVSEQRVRTLIRKGRIPGARRHGREWLIPFGTDKPTPQQPYRNQASP